MSVLLPPRDDSTALLNTDDIQASEVEHHLKGGSFFRSAPHSPGRIYELCGHSSMHVLGVSNSTATVTVDPSWVCAINHPSSRTPTITCAKASSIQLILYDRPQPKRMQYISLEPIALALGDKSSMVDDAKVDATEDLVEQQERSAKEARQRLVEKLKQHTISNRVPSARDKALRKIINQVNWSWELEQTLQKNAWRLGPRPKRSLSVSEQVMESASTMRNYVLSQLWTFFAVYLFPTIRKTFILFLLGHRMVAEMLLLILEFRIKPGYAALKDISATAQQIEIRLQQFCYWPMQYSKLRQRKANWASITTSHPDYIRFYNSLWLVANDVIIGIALGSYVIEHADWVAAQIGDLLRTYTVEALQSSISWLMDYPAGLKLNGELAVFLGDLFLWVIDYWSSMSPRHGILWFKKFQIWREKTLQMANHMFRLHRNPKPSTTKYRMVHRIHVLCRRQHANCAVFGSAVPPDGSHLLILPCISPHLPLAADDSPITLPPISRKEAKCAS